MLVKDAVCVVTGGANGIGRALAERFVAEEAAHVVIADVAADALAATADEIGATAIVTDVSSEASIQALIETTEADHGPIDLFVANAGIGGHPDGVLDGEGGGRAMGDDADALDAEERAAAVGFVVGAAFEVLEGTFGHGGSEDAERFAGEF